MYADYAQMQQYDEYLEQRSREFRDAQADAAWVRQWFERGVALAQALALEQALAGARRRYQWQQLLGQSPKKL